MKRRARSSRLSMLLVLASLGLASVASAGDPPKSAPISEDARKHFKAGVALLTDPGGARYEDAYREFKAAYAASPTPSMLGNVGLCAMKLERDEEAIKAYEGYLAGVPDLTPEERKQVETDLATLKAGVARLSLTFTANGAKVAGATIKDVRTPVQGAPVTNLYGPVDGALDVGVRPGVHAITVKAPGYAASTWEVESTSGAPQRHEFQLRKEGGDAPIGPLTPVPSVPAARPTPTSFYVVAGVSGAAAIGGVITGVLALKKNSDFKAANDGTNPTAADALRSSGKTLDTVTDVLFGVAIVGAAVSTVIYVTRPSVERASATHGPLVGVDARSRIVIDASPTKGGAAASIRAAF